MRCNDCQTDPLAHDQYCECCGEFMPDGVHLEAPAETEPEAAPEPEAPTASSLYDSAVRAAAQASSPFDSAVRPAATASSPFDSAERAAATATSPLDSAVRPAASATSPFDSAVRPAATATATATAPSPFDSASHPVARLGARCEACGSPTEAIGLCAPCQRAFGSILEHETPATVIPKAPEPQLVATVDTADAARAPELNVTGSDGQPLRLWAASDPAPVRVETAPRVGPEHQAEDVATGAVSAPVQDGTPLLVPPPLPVMDNASPQAADGARPARRPGGPVVPPRKSASRNSSGTRTAAFAAAAVVIIAAIGVPVGHRLFSSNVVGEEPAPVAAVPAPVAPAPPPQPVVPAPAPAATAVTEPAVPVSAAVTTPAVAVAPAPAPVDQASAVVPTKAVKKPAPVPAPKTAALKTSKTAKQTKASASKQPAVTHVAPEPVAAPAPAPVVAPPPPPPAPEPVEAPSGPFFEAGQVTEQPRVSAQVPLNVPDVYKGRAMNDVVILRVLVSQSGRASNVTMLRKSKAGAGLDEAVIASVKQWRFQPARRKGETVSCWFNVGVPLTKLE